jgi:hypothetical protein
MGKESVLAYCLMETNSEPIRPSNMKEMKSPMGLYYISFNSNLQSFHVRNRNGRTYYRDAMWESLNSPHIQELIRKKSWCGEAGHPMTEDVKRILTIDPKLISHKIYDINMKGNILNGTVETLSAGYGVDMTKHILQGLESAFSVRALAQINRTPDGQQLVKTKSHVVCYDWVILPSHPEAYQSSGDVKIFNKAVSESGNELVSNDKTVAIMENQIVDFIKEESHNLKLVSNLFEISSESMSITKDLKHLIVKEKNEKFYISIEDKIKTDISSYLSKL